MIRALPIATFALAAAMVPIVLVLVVRRFQLARRQQIRERLEDQVLPLALALVEGQTDGSEWEISRVEGEAIARVLTRYSRLLSGDAGERIGAFFEARGLVDATGVDAVSDRRAWRRATAASGLGEMASPRGIEPLLACLDDPDQSVRATAARGLARLGATEAVGPLVDGLIARRIPYVVVGQALLDIGPAALPALEPLIRVDDSSIRAIAIELITRLGDARWAGRLLIGLDDPSPEVRAQTCRALGRLGAEEAAARLRRALADPVPSVRAAAATGLGAIRDRAAVAPLTEHAKADAFLPGRSAARALARIAPDRVISLAAHPDGGPHLREMADRLSLGVP